MTMDYASRTKFSMEETVNGFSDYVSIDCGIENGSAKLCMVNRRFDLTMMERGKRDQDGSQLIEEGASQGENKISRLIPSSEHEDTDATGKDEYHPISATDNSDHLFAIIALCCVILTQAYLLISVFPYAGYMALHLLTTHGKDDINSSNVGTYAGVLSSAFMVGRFIASMAWGELADTYGRKSALVFSLVLSGILSLLFGASPTYCMALVYRFCLGLSNGLLAVTKTLVSELSNGNNSLEEKNMGLVLGVWAYGSLLCPGISGLLSEPLEQYPKLYDMLLSKAEGSPEETSNSLWGSMGRITAIILEQYPFLLPNIIAFLWCCISLQLVLRFVKETLSNEARRHFTYKSVVHIIVMKSNEMRIAASKFLGKKNFASGIQSFRTAKDGRRRQGLVSEGIQNEKGTIDTVPEEQASQSTLQNSFSSSPIKRIWSIRAARDHLLVYWLYVFYATLLDEAFPLFCMSQLGLSEYKIGEVLTGAGFLFVLGQYVFYTWSLKHFGLYGAMKSAVLITSFPVLIAASTRINVAGYNNSTNNVDGILSIYTLAYLSTVLAINKIAASSFFASITVMTNRTVDMDLRASVNGLSVMGGSVARAAAPIFVGSLITLCQTRGLGGLTIFGTISIIGFLIFAVARKMDERGLVG